MIRYYYFVYNVHNDLYPPVVFGFRKLEDANRWLDRKVNLVIRKDSANEYYIEINEVVLNEEL